MRQHENNLVTTTREFQHHQICAEAPKAQTLQPKPTRAIYNTYENTKELKYLFTIIFVCAGDAAASNRPVEFQDTLVMGPIPHLRCCIAFEDGLDNQKATASID